MLSVELCQLVSGHIPTGLRAQARQHQCQNIILQIPQEPRERLLKNKTIHCNYSGESSRRANTFKEIVTLP